MAGGSFGVPLFTVAWLTPPSPRRPQVADRRAPQAEFQKFAVTLNRAEIGSSGWTCRPVTSGPLGTRREV